MCRKKFSIYGFHGFQFIPRKTLNLCFFTHAPVPHSNFSFPARQNGWEEVMNFSIKIQSENMKMTWNISLFPFGMIAIFLNLMVFTILEIISVK